MKNFVRLSGLQLSFSISKYTFQSLTFTVNESKLKTSSQQLTPTQPLAHSPPLWDGRENHKSKSEKNLWVDIKTVQQVKQKFCMQAKQNEEFIHHLPWAGRCSGTPRNAEPYQMSLLLGKTNIITLNHPPHPSFFFPDFYIPSIMLCGMGYLWSFRVSSPGCVTSQVLVHLQPTHWWSEKRKIRALALHKGCSAKIKTFLLSTLFSAQIQNTAPHQLGEVN